MHIDKDLVAEAATNISKHATRGEILLRSAGETARAVELVGIDSGPGIRDVEQALRDGYSTAGSSGTGLGAVTESGSCSASVEPTRDRC